MTNSGQSHMAHPDYQKAQQAENKGVSRWLDAIHEYMKAKKAEKDNVP